MHVIGNCIRFVVCIEFRSLFAFRFRTTHNTHMPGHPSNALKAGVHLRPCPKQTHPAHFRLSCATGKTKYAMWSVHNFLEQGCATGFSCCLIVLKKNIGNWKLEIWYWRIAFHISFFIILASIFLFCFFFFSANWGFLLKIFVRIRKSIWRMRLQMLQSSPMPFPTVVRVFDEYVWGSMFRRQTITVDYGYDSDAIIDSMHSHHSHQYHFVESVHNVKLLLQPPGVSKYWTPLKHSAHNRGNEYTVIVAPLLMVIMLGWCC